MFLKFLLDVIRASNALTMRDVNQLKVKIIAASHLGNALTMRDVNFLVITGISSSPKVMP